jgi:hypothetical protein
MSEALADAPPSVRRLLAHYDTTTLGEHTQTFLIGRLLEEGERRDLRWLVRQVGEGALAAWMETAGPKQLSCRSRAFWSTVLAVEASTAEENPLWLL